MEDRQGGREARPEPTMHQGDLRLLVVLFVLTLALRMWMIAHTAVAARDSIGYIRVAWKLAHLPTLEVLRGEHHPPAYPLTILAVSQVVRAFYPGTLAETMQLSAQLASTVAGLLLILPTYYLGKAIFDRQVGFWAALLLQCIPVGARAFSDGLTEGLFLLLLLTGMLAALYGLRGGSTWYFAWSGLCAGMAYLTRPEGLLLLFAVMVCLAILAVQSRFGWTRRRLVLSACTTIACTLVIAAPYMAVIGGLSNKTTGKWVLQGSSSARLDTQPSHDDDSEEANVDLIGGPLLAMAPLAVWTAEWTEGTPGASAGWAFKALLSEVGVGFHYIFWLPALVSLGWHRRRLVGDPGCWPLLLVVALHLALLFRVATVAGYVSERHSLLTVACGSFGAVAVLRDLPAWLATRLGVQTRWFRPSLAANLLLAASVALGLPSDLKTLHHKRAGHRAVGEWLAAQLGPYDYVVDPFCWAEFYSGRSFLLDHVPAPPPGVAPRFFAVVETSTPHSRLPLWAKAKEIQAQGCRVYHWPPHLPPEKASLFVYLFHY